LKTLAILTSGGDAPGMNTAIAAATKVATALDWHVVGVENGYDGLIDGRFVDLRPADVDPHWTHGGTFLGSARCARFRTPEGRRLAAHNLVGTDGLIVIGGNGSLTGAHLLHKETGVPVVGVPASIDNDIGCTSTCIGVDTALNTIVQACDRISDTARSHRRAFIVEVMGRECGYLAMNAAIASGADAVIFREQGKDLETLVDELRGTLRRGFAATRGKRRVLIIKAEGVEVSPEQLGKRLQETLEEDAPGVALRVIVLGHVVRGGAPSFRDRLVGGRLAHSAVRAIVDGKVGTMVAWKPEFTEGEDTTDPYCRLIPFETVIEKTRTLLDGSHPTTRRRLRMLEAVQGILPI